jgi:hypothetical protein
LHLGDAKLGRSFDVKSRVVGLEESVHSFEIVILYALEMDLVKQERETVLFPYDLERFLGVEYTY